MTLTTPPAVRPNSAGAPVAITWNSLTASSVMSIARALAADLLAEEAVVVVAAVEADVVEDAALAGERDLVAVRPLHDADARRERQQILELAAEDRQRSRPCSSLSVVAAAVRVDSMTRGEVRTVTVSATPDTFIATGSVTVWPTVSTTFSCTCVANPAA